MNKTKIEWTDYSWNPIKGLCPVGCWYCYAKNIYKRFHMDETVRFDSDEFLRMFMLYKPSKIFCCSTIELFHPQIESWWRDLIFDGIEKNPRHTFQILTKMPENIDRPMPDNVWLGVSVTKSDEMWKIYEIERKDTKVKFVSFEPLLDLISMQYIERLGRVEIFHADHINWIIIGAMTKNGKTVKQHAPKREWIEDIVNYAKKQNVSIFLKGNLKEIWGERLIQEFPT